MIETTILQRPAPKVYLAKPGAQRRVKRRTISVAFRNLLAEHLPGLNKKPAYWQFIGYLLFGCQFDEQTGRLMLWKETLAEITGYDLNNFTAIRFLEDFQRDVMPPGSFDWEEYDLLRGKCRQVKRCVWPKPIEAALVQELSKQLHNEGRVYLDGSLFSRKKANQERDNERREAKRPRELHTDAILIQNYMNTRASNLFTGIVASHYENALSVANALPRRRARLAQLRILKAIREQPQPIYGASREGNTARLVTSEDIPNLQRDVRHALTPDWSEADLRCSQLAICAWQWNVPRVLEFLATGENVWKYLSQKIGVPASHFDEAKGTLKKALYSTCYGMEKRHVQAFVTRRLKRYRIMDGGMRFVQEELIAALIEAREAAISRINTAGGARDCYGHWIPTDGGRKEEGILAELAQAWEMKLIIPIFELARDTDFQVLLYQFDGVSIHFTRRKEEWREKINVAVAARADELGIITHLEWKD